MKDDGDAERGGVEIVSVVDSGGLGMYVSCHADIATGDMVAGLCDLIAQVTRAVLANPQATRAGDIGLDDGVF